MASEQIYQELADLKHNIEKIAGEMRADRAGYNDRQTKRQLEFINCVREIYKVVDDLRKQEEIC